MERLFSLVILVGFLTGEVVGAESTVAGWSEGGDGVWVAEVQGWKLEVSKERGRLTGLFPGKGDNVLIEGGHRVWLGPQTEWGNWWPPPADWEASAAAGVTVSEEGGTLTLELPRADKAFPAVARSYRLVEEGVVLGMSWGAVEGRCFQGVQILQVTPRAVAELPWSGEDDRVGFLPLAERPGFSWAEVLPVDVAKAAPDGAALRVGVSGREEKLGFKPRSLAVTSPGGGRFAMMPGVSQGGVVGAPDEGLYTQVYFGAAEWAMLEVEQLSPRLKPVEGRAGFEVFLKLEPASSAHEVEQE